MADESKCQCKKLQKQLKRYETRFSDLVSSYKTIIEEKKVLEETLKTLSSPRSNATKTTENSESSHSKDTGDPLGGTAAADNSKNDVPAAAPDAAQIHLLEEKISALSKALNSVTEGKAKMEEAFKNDRKNLIVEHTIQLHKAEEEKEGAVRREGELRGKLRQEQVEREDESKANVLMLKELQEILATERNEKDALKLMLQEKDFNAAVAATVEESKTTAVSVESEAGLEEEEDEEREDETVEADQMYNPSVVDHLQLDAMANSLIDHKAQEERRIAELESKISELSDVVGSYDRKRHEDQSVIRKLRDRLENLELENTVLQTTQSSGNAAGFLTNIPDPSPSYTFPSDSTHQSCQEEYKRLLEEFDQYKRKHKERISKDSAQEVVEYKQRMCRLEREMDRMKVYHEERERSNLQIISQLQMDITRSKEEREGEVDDTRKEMKLLVEQMEGELRKQRERTVDVIADRDKEIERLQLKLLEFEGSAKVSATSPAIITTTESSVVAAETTKKEESFAANEILAQSPSQTASDNLFYFTQQVAHYDTELYTCRMQILDMESQLRDYEKSEENLGIQMRELKEEIRSLERNKSRESANLEYLKNVCLQYILSDSSTVKIQLTSAISTVLHFSPDEMKQIRKKQKGGWW